MVCAPASPLEGETLANPFPVAFEDALPGERPDTVRLQGLPCLWLGASRGLPSEEQVKSALATFGPIAAVAILSDGKDGGEEAQALALNCTVYVQFAALAPTLKLLASCRGRYLQRTMGERTFKASAWPRRHHGDSGFCGNCFRRGV
jgi:hypothetical protein